jgi:hypothetical protein
VVAWWVLLVALAIQQVALAGGSGMLRMPSHHTPHSPQHSPAHPSPHPPLQTSLAQFNELYAAAIDGAERAVVPSKRVLNITDHLTHSIYLYVQRGLFERHKLIFALMLTTKILVGAGAGGLVGASALVGAGLVGAVKAGGCWFGGRSMGGW